MEVQEVKLSIIELTPKKALLFNDFVKHYDWFRVLKKRKVFELERGKVILNVVSGAIRNTKIEVSFDE